MFIELLEEMKNNNPLTNYHYDGKYKENKLIEIDYVAIQTELMYYHAQRFYDIIYIDMANGTNKHDMGLIIFSGINHEKQSVLLGYALILEDDYKNYYNAFGTFFNKFLQRKAPRLVITDIHFERSRALNNIITEETTHLFCQWHVKRFIKNRFIHLNVMNAQSSAQLMYEIMISLIFTDDKNEFEDYENFLFFESKENHFSGADYQFLRDLIGLKHKWAKSQIPSKLFIASDSYNIVRAESINQMISTRLFADSTLCALFKIIRDIDEVNNDRYSYET